MSERKVLAILQSNYIPWKGYFDIMAAVDEFVLYDEVQFTRRDWRNRNKIVLNGEPHWLTIPVASKGRYHEPIDTITVSDASWADRHWQTIRQAYRRAPFFETYRDRLAETYEHAARLEKLSAINELFLTVLSDYLGLTTVVTHSRDVPREAETATDRLLEICSARSATDYVSGPAARAYIDPEAFSSKAIALHYANYSGYPPYPQDSEILEHGVSVVDLLMHCGPQARDHLKAARDRTSFLDPP